MIFFFNDTATTEIYTLSLHDALPISTASRRSPTVGTFHLRRNADEVHATEAASTSMCAISSMRSEEHTSELQSRQYLVCRLLLEKKKRSEIRFPLHSLNTYVRTATPF